MLFECKEINKKKVIVETIFTQAKLFSSKKVEDISEKISWVFKWVREKFILE